MPAGKAQVMKIFNAKVAQTPFEGCEIDFPTQDSAEGRQKREEFFQKFVKGNEQYITQ